jgi:hypothetical protein
LEARWGLVVRLRDGATGAQICEATVTAFDGGYSETLQMSPPYRYDASTDCWFGGASERAGTYVIDARATGYPQKTLADVEVGHDACQVVTRTVTIEM